MAGKHTLIMLLCCVIPLAAIFAVSVLGISLDSIGILAMVVLCPLLHILMMRGHNHGGQQQPACHDAKGEVKEALPQGRA